MKDCDADAEKTVGRSSSINLSTRSLYNLYTLAMHEICGRNKNIVSLRVRNVGCFHYDKLNESVNMYLL